MTRTQKIEALAEKYKKDFDRNDNPKVFSPWSFKAGILAGIALRDAELLEVGLDKKKLSGRALNYFYEHGGTASRDAHGAMGHFEDGARWQHEQMIKAIKGEI